jgi:hypothetical protein
LLGLPPRDLAYELGDTGTETLPVPPEHVIVGIPADLIRRRPDIRRAEREVAAQSARIGIAAAELFPTFSIQGQLNWQAADFADLLTPASSAGFIQPGFNWNILNYGRIANNIGAQDARFQQLAVTYQQAVLSANREVEDAIIQFLRAHDRLQQLAKASEKADTTYEFLARNFVTVGVDMNRLDAVTRTKVQANDDFISGQADVALALIRVYRAIGGGWQLRFGCGIPVATEAPLEADSLGAPPMPEVPTPAAPSPGPTAGQPDAASAPSGGAPEPPPAGPPQPGTGPTELPNANPPTQPGDPSASTQGANGPSPPTAAPAAKPPAVPASQPPAPPVP